MKRGNVIVSVMAIMSLLLTMAVSLGGIVISSTIKIQKTYQRLSALSYAEAGINKTLFKINQGTDTGWLDAAKTAGGKREAEIAGGEYRVWIKDCVPASNNCYYVESTGYQGTEAKPMATRTVRVKLNGVQTVTELNFSFSIQSNANKVELRNNSTVKGSVYSNGEISMGVGTTITRNAISAGTTPATSYIGTKGTIKGNANAFTVSGTQVDGTTTAGTYPAQQPMPISDAELATTITNWENTASTGWNSPGPGPLVLNGNNTLGPAKIDGDLIINGGDLKVTGVIWVKGDITIADGSHVYLDSSFGDNSGVIIADDPDNRTTKGKIKVGKSAVISGTQRDNPKTTSYLLMLSTKTSNSSNWNTDEGYAIDLDQVGVQGGVYYAPYGSFHKKNHGQIRAVACNGLVLDNLAIIDYDGNWGNSGISTGPAGKWTITEWLILY